MSIKKSLEAYKVKKLNCAQSILHGFGDSHNIDEEEILEAKKYGGGKAPENRCGALHSALSLTSNESERKKIEESFEAEAGSLKCREIRSLGKLPCSGCVELSARLLEESIIGKN